MALVLRTVTGTLKKPSGAEWEDGKIRFSLVSTQADTGGIIVPNLTVEATAGTQGAFSIPLYTLEDSFLNYVVMLPNGESQEISLPDGEGDAQLADLLDTAAQSEEIAIRPATITELGGVMPDGDTITVDENGVISAVGTGGTWGSITGTLSNQTDLQNALDGKASSLGADDNYATDAEKVKLANLSGTNTGDETAQRIGDLVSSLTSKATPVDADQVGLMDSAAGNIWKKLSWANIKAALKTYFDTLYQAILVSGTNIKTINGSSVLGSGDLTVSGGIGGTTGAVDNALLRADGTGGGTAQSSSVTLDDSNTISGVLRLLGTTGGFVGFGDAKFGDILANGNTCIGFNSASKSIQFLDNANTPVSQIDGLSSSTDTALLIMGDGSLKRVKMEAASGGKRILYVDA